MQAIEACAAGHADGIAFLNPDRRARHIEVDRELRAVFRAHGIQLWDARLGRNIAAPRPTRGKLALYEWLQLEKEADDAAWEAMEAFAERTRR
jgi:hypothetical protein